MIKVGVGAIIFFQNKILLIQRAPSLGSGTWSTPGGQLEFGELPEKCANREALEEVGYPGGTFQFLAITNDVFEQRHFVTIWMRCDCDELWDLKCSDEVLQHGWFTLEELPTPLFVPFRNLLTGDGYGAQLKERQS